MDEQGIKLKFTELEMGDSFRDLDRQHTQIRWYVQVYTVSLIGFFTLFGYLAGQPGLCYSLIGVMASLIVFALGWVLITILSHKISNIIMVHKQLAQIKEIRRKIDKINFKKEDYVPISLKAEVKPIGLFRYLPYLIFSLNFSLLLGTFFFFLNREMEWAKAAVDALCAGAIMAIFYPKACTSYNEHIKSAEYASNISNRDEKQKEYEKARKGLDWDNWYLWCAACSGISMLCLAIWNHRQFLSKQLKFSLEHHTIIAISLAALYGIFRYYYEITKKYHKERHKYPKKAIQKKIRE